jgi:histidinol-phosphate/aromatic aminotransferase/cobyric acid decarboxylase-like protein
VIDHARQEGVVLRDARDFRGLDTHIRVSIRLPDENDQLIAALSGI